MGRPTRSAARTGVIEGPRKNDILSFLIKHSCQMGTCGSAYIVILSTGQCKLSQERGSLVNFFDGLQGFKLLQVFADARVAKLVSVLIILRFIIHAVI